MGIIIPLEWTLNKKYIILNLVNSRGIIFTGKNTKRTLEEKIKIVKKIQRRFITQTPMPKIWY